MNSHKVISPSRTYIVICRSFSATDDPRGDRFYFRRFKLPESTKTWGFLNQEELPLPNNGETAIWYYLNRLDPISYAEGVVPAEAWKLRDVDERGLTAGELLLAPDETTKP